MKILLSSLAAILLLALVLFVAPAFAGEGADEVEPNDTMELADSIDGFMIYGNMDEEDGTDWFKLDGQEGLRPTFTVYFDEEDVEVDYAVYSDDELVEEATGYGTGEQITCDVPGTCYIKVWWWEGEGDYRIRISPESEDECQGDDEVEPNNDVDLADLIVDELEIHGYICEDDDDWFELDGQEGTEPTFTINYDDEDCEIDFEVYSGDELVGTAVEYGSGDSVTCEVPGRCYVHVYYWSGEGEYTIEIEP
jgi:hypothetical protein